MPYIIEYRICPKSGLDNVILLNLQEYKIRIENGNYDNVLSWQDIFYYMFNCCQVEKYYRIDIVYSLQSLCRLQAQQIQVYFAISRKHTHRLEESTEYSIGKKVFMWIR